MDKPILFLNEAAQSESFTTTRTPPVGKNIPPRDRLAHAVNLSSKFDIAWNSLEEQRQQRKALSLPSREGCYLEVVGQSGFELLSSSLEDRKSKRILGARLISVVTSDNQEKRAIVYIPSGQENKFNEYPHLYLNSFLIDAEAINSLSNSASPKYLRLKL